MPPHRKQVLSDTCNLCNLEVTHLKRHVLKTHLPWYIIPSYVCIDCQISEGSGNQFQYFIRDIEELQEISTCKHCYYQ